MKRTVILLFGLACMAITLAEKPLSKKNLRVNSQITIPLKSSNEDYLPLNFITEYWDGTSWGDPKTTTLKYYDNGLLWVSESEEERMTYIYYDDGKLMDKIKESFNGINWINDYKYTYIYDDHEILCQKLIYYWDASNWILSDGSWVERFYDTYDKLIGEISYYYDFPDGWIEIYGYKTEYLYVDGLLKEQTDFDRYNGEWIASWKYVWTYNDHNLLDGGLEYYFDGTRFVLAGRYIDVSWYYWDPGGHVQSSYVEAYTYQNYIGPAFPREEPDNDIYYEDIERLIANYPDGDGSGTPPTTIETYQIYDDGWLNDFRWTWVQMADYESELDEIWSKSSWLKYNYTMDYQTDILKYQMKESYSGGVLSKASKQSEIYDGFGNQTESKSETRSGDEDWIQQDGEKWIFIYDGATSKILTKTYQDWDDGASLYVNSMRENFIYSSTDLDLLSEKTIEVYPTVFKSNIVVQTDLPGKLIIYNVGGGKVTERSVYGGNNLIDCSRLNKGLYILKVSTKNGECIQKVIKQ